MLEEDCSKRTGACMLGLSSIELCCGQKLGDRKDVLSFLRNNQFSHNLSHRLSDHYL